MLPVIITYESEFTKTSVPPFFQMSRHCCTYYSVQPSDQHVCGLCEDIMWMGTTLLRNFRIENKQLSVYLAAVRGFDGYSHLFPVKTHS